MRCQCYEKNGRCENDAEYMLFITESIVTKAYYIDGFYLYICPKHFKQGLEDKNT